MQQERLGNHMVFHPVAGRALFTLLDHDRVGAAFARLLIHRREYILARRDAARKLDRTQVTDYDRGRMVEGLQRASGRAR